MHAWTKVSSRFCLSFCVGSPGICWLLGSVTNLFTTPCPCAGCVASLAVPGLEAVSVHLRRLSTGTAPHVVGSSAPLQRTDGLGVLVLDPQAQERRRVLSRPPWEAPCSPQISPSLVRAQRAMPWGWRRVDECIGFGFTELSTD